MRKLSIFLSLVLAFHVSFADYLVTNRKTSVKQQPSSHSDVVMQVEDGTKLMLLDDGNQTNGYYHVESTLFSGDGWIYRTFVRRFAGDGGMTSASLSGDVEVRVVDVGAGLCSLIKLPGDKFIIYDAGVNSNAVMSEINDIIPAGSTIELMVLSHTDADHIGVADKLLQTYHIKKVLWTGYETSMTGTGMATATYQRLFDELNNQPSVQNINLHERDSVITPGNKIKFGNVTLTFLCGFGKPPAEWGLTEKAEMINSVSIVMKLTYGNNSILFCGDAVGRHNTDNDVNALIATEKYLVDNASALLPSTILIAPHHGANNGSSTAFIDKVKPKKVIFSCGHKFGHPRAAAAMRYLTATVGLSNIYRTDRGDDESPQFATEWDYTRVNGCTDLPGDDDVDIVLKGNGTYKVNYVAADPGCD